MVMEVFSPDLWRILLERPLVELLEQLLGQLPLFSRFKKRKFNLKKQKEIKTVKPRINRQVYDTPVSFNALKH